MKGKNENVDGASFGRYLRVGGRWCTIMDRSQPTTKWQTNLRRELAIKSFAECDAEKFQEGFKTVGSGEIAGCEFWFQNRIDQIVIMI